MSNPQELISLLSDGKFHSGEEIARIFGVSRAAVWKKLSKLKDQLGLEVFAVRGRGYSLRDPINLLSAEKIAAKLSVEALNAFGEPEIFQQIESTNAYLMHQLSEGKSTPGVCLAEQQSAGRGRRGRDWISPFGKNIYLSMLWHFMLPPTDLGGLSLAVGVGVVRGLREHGVTEASLKWPNDILHESKKLAGILIEMTGEQSGPSSVVVGLGLNVSMSEEQGESIDQPWTALNRLSGGGEADRSHLSASLINHITDVLKAYEQQGLKALLDEWRSYDQHIGQEVMVTVGDRVIEGRHEGVDASGALLVRVGGQVETFFAGEVSLRSSQAS